jgi:hypothetical protein
MPNLTPKDKQLLRADLDLDDKNDLGDYYSRRKRTNCLRGKVLNLGFLCLMMIVMIILIQEIDLERMRGEPLKGLVLKQGYRGKKGKKVVVAYMHEVFDSTRLETKLKSVASTAPSS